MITGLAHVCLAATDLAEVERFYCSGLGLHKAFNFVREGEVVGFYLDVGRSGYIEVFLRKEVDAKAKGGIQHFCIEVEDLDPVGARLTELGFDVTEKKLGADQSWQMWTTDPSGVRIEFHQYTDQSSQRTGEDCVLG